MFTFLQLKYSVFIAIVVSLRERPASCRRASDGLKKLHTRLGFYPVNNIASSFLFTIKWLHGPYRGIGDGVWGILMRFGGYAYTTEIMWIIYIIFVAKNSMAVKPTHKIV